MQTRHPALALRQASTRGAGGGGRTTTMDDEAQRSFLAEPEPDPEDSHRPVLAEMMEGSGPVLIMGLILGALVLLFLWLLLGDWVWWLAPVGLIAWFYGWPLLANYHAQEQRDAPLTLPGHGQFTGPAKRRLLAGGSLLLLAAMVALVLANLAFGVGLGELREWLLGWRV